MATTPVSYTTASAEFDAIVSRTMSGSLNNWFNATAYYALTPNYLYTYASWSPGATDGLGISNALYFTGDFETSLSIPSGAIITHIKPYVSYKHYKPWTGRFHSNILDTQTSQYYTATLGSQQTDANLWPGSGRVTEDWGISAVQATNIVTGTTGLRIWTECLFDGSSNYHQAYIDFAKISFKYTVEEAIATQEGGYLIGMAV